VDRPAPLAPESGFPRGATVLLVEDDAVLGRRILAYLEGRGAEVSCARSLAEARNLLRAERHDFVLLDMHLPDGSGLALLRGRGGRTGSVLR